MSEDPFEAIEQLEKLAAWHRINAEYAGADWVWEARLKTAENLEREAAKIRARLHDRRTRQPSPIRAEFADFIQPLSHDVSLLTAPNGAIHAGGGLKTATVQIDPTHTLGSAIGEWPSSGTDKPSPTSCRLCR